MGNVIAVSMAGPKHPMRGTRGRSIPRLLTSSATRRQLRLEAHDAEASSRSCAAIGFSTVWPIPGQTWSKWVKVGQSGSKWVKVISTIIFLQPHDPKPDGNGTLYCKCTIPIWLDPTESDQIRLELTRMTQPHNSKPVEIRNRSSAEWGSLCNGGRLFGCVRADASRRPAPRKRCLRSLRVVPLLLAK